MMTFPTEWKNKIHVPKQQPDYGYPIPWYSWERYPMVTDEFVI
jgi:hypothetical protein